MFGLLWHKPVVYQFNGVSDVRLQPFKLLC